jgi:hypothetical protein
MNFAYYPCSKKPTFLLIKIELQFKHQESPIQIIAVKYPFNYYNLKLLVIDKIGIYTYQSH